MVSFILFTSVQRDSVTTVCSVNKEGNTLVFITKRIDVIGTFSNRISVKVVVMRCIVKTVERSCTRCHVDEGLADGPRLNVASIQFSNLVTVYRVEVIGP